MSKVYNWGLEQEELFVNKNDRKGKFDEDFEDLEDFYEYVETLQKDDLEDSDNEEKDDIDDEELDSDKKTG